MAIKQRNPFVSHVLIDGDVSVEMDGLTITTQPRADEQYIGVALASILAKVTRDRHMVGLSKQVDPRFKDIFADGKGYCHSQAHSQMMQEGIFTIYHRRSYEPLKSYLRDHYVGTPLPDLTLLPDPELPATAESPAMERGTKKQKVSE
jgi:ribonuclease HII